MTVLAFVTRAWAQAAEAPPEEAPPVDEAALFGAPVAVPAEASPVPAGTEAALFGGAASSAPTGGGMDAALAEADDRLAVGGRLWWEWAAVVPETGTGPEDVALSSPSLVDLFADARPNDRVRAYVRGRLNTDFTVKDGDIDPFTLEPAVPVEALLDQAWLKFDIGRKVFVTAGRQRVKWGVGRFWNPTDFLNLRALDPLAPDDLRTGVDLVRFQVPMGISNLSGVALVGGASDLAEVGGALRSEVVVGRSEFAATAVARQGTPYRAGLDVSSGVSIFDLRVESAMVIGPDVHGWDGTFDLSTSAFPTEVNRGWKPVPQVVAGLETTFKTGDKDTVSVGVEGFYNGLGVDDAGLYPWLLTVGEFTPFYLGQWYTGAYVLLPCPGACDDHSFTVSGLANLTDGTELARFDWRGQVLTWLAVDAWIQGHAGEAGGEFRFAVDVPPVVGIEGLEDGLSIPPPLVTLGGGAQVRF